MNEQDKIVVDNDFFEDSIWMSYRYCIGRKTIAAVSRAADIARYAKYLSENRRKFNAKDIRNEISYTLRFSNISVEGSEYNYDAYTIIYSYMQSNEIDFAKNRVIVNVCDGSIKFEPLEPESTSRTYNPKNDSNDIIPWIELANYMAGEFYIITVKYEGKTEELECIKTFNPQTLETCWKTVNNIEKGLNHWYLADEYITNIVKKNI